MFEDLPQQFKSLLVSLVEKVKIFHEDPIPVKCSLYDYQLVIPGYHDTQGTKLGNTHFLSPAFSKKSGGT